MKETIRQKLQTALDKARVNLSEGIRATIEVLNEDPEEPDVLYQLDGLLSMALSNMEQYALFDKDLLADPRVVARMKVCSNCGVKWAPRFPRNVYKISVVNNPIGGKCPECNKIFCRRCAADPSGELCCPSCKTGTLPQKRVPLDVVSY